MHSKEVQTSKKFCKRYKINSQRCAAELFSFAKAFKYFDFGTVESKSYVADYSDDSSAEEEYNELENNTMENHQTFIDCLSVLTDSNYKLIDAYPTLVRVYSIAVAIPITSCSGERSFSTLKRVKTRLRSSMLQERLEGLMLMSIERNILLKLDIEKLIDLLGKSSKVLANALL